MHKSLSCSCWGEVTLSHALQCPPQDSLALAAVVHRSQCLSTHLLAGHAVRDLHLRGRKELRNQELFISGGNENLLHLRDLSKSSNQFSRAWIRSLHYKRPQSKAVLRLFPEPSNGSPFECLISFPQPSWQDGSFGLPSSEELRNPPCTLRIYSRSHSL